MRTQEMTGLAFLFALVGSLPISASGTISNFMAERAICYTQINEETVLLNECEPYRGCVGILETGPESLLDAVSITWPDGSVAEIEVEDDSEGLGWWSYDGFDTLEELNAAFPAGSYSIAATKRSGGTTQVNLSIDSPDFSPAPFITNFDALQSIDPTEDTTIEWNAWENGTASDVISITVENWRGSVIYSNHADILSGAGNTTGVNRSYAIPAETLEAGGTYTLSVLFMKTYGLHLSGGVPDFPTAMKTGTAETETSLTIQVAGRKSPFQPTQSLGGKWDDMWGWIDDTYFPWCYSYGLNIWIYLYDGATVDTNNGYWVCYLLADGSDFGWGFAYPSGSWWCITSDLATHWLTPHDPLP